MMACDLAIAVVLHSVVLGVVDKPYNIDSRCSSLVEGFAIVAFSGDL